jgi:hypothetical protein
LTASGGLVYCEAMRPDPSTRRARALISALALSVLVSWVAGCITIDGTLRDDGTGTLSMSYMAPPGSTEASQRELLAAPGITIKSLSLGDDRKLSTTLDVDNLAAIGRTALFRNVTVTTTAEGDDQVLRIKMVNQPKTLHDKSLPGPKIGITLPGKVIEANEKATVDGSHVEWTFPLADWVGRSTWELTARYHPAKSAGAESGTAAPAAKPDAGSK